MSSSEEKLNEVPPGVRYDEKVDVPVGNGKAKGLVDTGYEDESNPRLAFLQSHSDPKKYAFFTDKEGLKEWNFKPGFENDRRLPDYNSSTTGTHWFRDTQLTDSDPIYCREIIQLPQNDDKRYQFFTKPDKKYKEVNFFDGRQRSLGKFKDSTQETSTGFMNYIFEDGRSDSEQKLFYEGDSLLGGRRKRRTKAKKSKKRRTNKRSKSRS
jgi:hypothetical protein